MARDRFGYGTDRHVEEKELEGLRGDSQGESVSMQAGSSSNTMPGGQGFWADQGGFEETWFGDAQSIDPGMLRAVGFIPAMPDPSHYKDFKSYSIDLGKYGQLAHGMLASKAHGDKNFTSNRYDQDTIDRIAKKTWSTASDAGTNLKGSGTEEIAYAAKVLSHPKHASAYRKLPKTNKNI